MFTVAVWANKKGRNFYASSVFNYLDTAEAKFLVMLLYKDKQNTKATEKNTTQTSIPTLTMRLLADLLLFLVV